MLKIIQFLVYTFTNRLTKIINVYLSNGLPSDVEEVNKLRSYLEMKYKCDVVVYFDDSGVQTRVEEIYTKRK